MTADAFRRLALAQPFAQERAHMNHPDFRIHDRIFASLPRADGSLGMVKLTPAQQQEFVNANPGAFAPVPGGWGARGATYVHLSAAKTPAVRRALRLAWENTAPPSLRAEIAAPRVRPVRRSPRTTARKKR